MYYGSDIMREAGVSLSDDLSKNESSLLLYIVLSVMNAVGSITSIFCIDRLGRRYLILRSMPLAAIAWIVTAVGMGYRGLAENNEDAGG